MNRQPISRMRRDIDLNIKDRYNQAYKKYISGQFSYNSHCLIRKLCQNGQKQPNMQGVPIYKLMIQISKIMMMNQLELLFFGATIQQMNWKIIEKCLEVYIDDVTDLTPKINKDQYVKKIQLSLLLIAYIVKIYLNQDSTLYDYKIRDLVKNNFDKMYQEWVTKVQNNFKFSPKHMNKLFKEFDKQNKNIKSEIVDYNYLVHQLFKNNFEEINPIYQPKYYGQGNQGNQGNNNNIKTHRRLNNNEKQLLYQREQQFQQNRFNNANLSIHQQSRQQYYISPPLRGSSLSNKSQKSTLRYGKRQSIHYLFDKDQIKPQQPFLDKNFSKEENY